MARLARKPSETGIYHVIMRGVNRQNIYDEPEDYHKFISILNKYRFRYDDKGTPCGTNCTYYAYCLMSNHCHLLIQQEEESVGETIKRISVAYAYYYNKKYGRDGHLFKERFRSEPVNDLTYFYTLLRYIHQNPVKGGIVKRVEDYEYSSWGEYTSEVPSVFQICNTDHVFKHITFPELKEIVNENLPDDFECLEKKDSWTPRKKMTDDQVRLQLSYAYGVDNSTDFQHLDRELQIDAIRMLKQSGATIRQLERLLGIGRNFIQRA